MLTYVSRARHSVFTDRLVKVYEQMLHLPWFDEGLSPGNCLLAMGHNQHKRNTSTHVYKGLEEGLLRGNVHCTQAEACALVFPTLSG